MAAKLPIRPRHIRSDTSFQGDVGSWLMKEMQPWPAITGLYDRFPLIGELIYGPLLRGAINPVFSNNEQAFLHYMSQFHGMDPLVIFCLPSLETVTANLGKTEQPREIMRASQQTRRGIYWAYWSLYHTMRASGRRVLRYDYTVQAATYPLGRVRYFLAEYGRAHDETEKENV